MNSKKDRSDIVSISEFLQLSSLSEVQVLRMLEDGELSFLKGPAGELCIDITTISPDDLAKRCSTSELSNNKKDPSSLHEEKIASEIVSHLDGIIDDAMTLALKWHSNKKRSTEESS